MLNIKINGKQFTANAGEKLSDVLIQNKFAVEHPCGGRGTCKKCRVKINGQEVLSCQYVLESDVEVELDDLDDNQLPLMGVVIDFDDREL